MEWFCTEMSKTGTTPWSYGGVGESRVGRASSEGKGLALGCSRSSWEASMAGMGMRWWCRELCGRTWSRESSSLHRSSLHVGLEATPGLWLLLWVEERSVEGLERRVTSCDLRWERTGSTLLRIDCEGGEVESPASSLATGAVVLV